MPEEFKMQGCLLAMFSTLIIVSTMVVETGIAKGQPAKEPSKSVLVTGCLIRGDESGEVWLVRKDGTIYGLEGRKIDLNSHIGQTVEVTGYVLPEGREEAAEEAQEASKSAKHETADFRVQSLKMVSKSCAHGG